MPEHNITGQAIYETYKEVQAFSSEPSGMFSWDSINKAAQITYNLIAEKLNAQYLAPLQGLVREYQLLARESLSIESNGDLREWQDRKSALDDQAVALLKDEQEEKE